jgi:hypothetical protein
MTLRLNGSTSGYTEIDAPAVAGSNTLLLPAGNGNAFQIMRNGATAGSLEFVDNLVRSTAVASTSGTAIDFTGIPSWAKRVTVMFNGVSTNGSSVVQVQLGAGSFTTSGYNSASGSTNNVANGISSTTGIVFTNYLLSVDTRSGHLIATNITGNTWVSSHSGFLPGQAFGSVGGGSVTLPGTLDRVRITTVNGTDTFDAGSINIMYE